MAVNSDVATVAIIRRDLFRLGRSGIHLRKRPRLVDARWKSQRPTGGSRKTRRCFDQRQQAKAGSVAGRSERLPADKRRASRTGRGISRRREASILDTALGSSKVTCGLPRLREWPEGRTKAGQLSTRLMPGFCISQLGHRRWVCRRRRRCRGRTALGFCVPA